MHRNKSVNVHDFAMIPRADIPRSSFRQQHAHKTTHDADYLIPIYCQEVLPGDSFNLKATIFSRLTTPLFPIMDNMRLNTFFFFVPNRLLWDNWQKFMGEQENPGDSTSYVIPECQSPDGGFAVNSIYDYLGLPTVGQVLPGERVEVNALPLRAYNLIWNEWFRDENLQNSITVLKTDGPDASTLYQLRKRGKRHDYFTSGLPWPQKGTAPTISLGSVAPVKGQFVSVDSVGANANNMRVTSGGTTVNVGSSAFTGNIYARGQTGDLYADLTLATGVTVNQLRTSFQIQKLLERDARGGTRYTEIVRSHFGVTSPDARLQRPEYIGGGQTNVNINPITQNSATGASGTTTPLGELGAMGTALAHNHGFRYSATEHGYFIGLMCITADLNYQQGLDRMWSRRTRYDFYFPAFAHLGEQAVLSKEIYADGSGNDEQVFAYQERWAEYRYKRSQVTGLFRSTSAGTIDPWHLAQRFNTRPQLNATFIESTTPLARALAVGAAANGKQFYCDMFFDAMVARPMPTYSVPGLIDHF